MLTEQTLHPEGQAGRRRSRSEAVKHEKKRYKDFIKMEVSNTGLNSWRQGSTLPQHSDSSRLGCLQGQTVVKYH